MTTRTVRLDEEAEATLLAIRQAAGLPISEVLKRGLQLFRERLHDMPAQTRYRVYERLDPGDGGTRSLPRSTSSAA